MFGISSRRKRTLVEQIVDKARKSIVKQRDYHKRMANEYAVLSRKSLDDLKRHKEIYEALDVKLANLDGPRPTIAPELALAMDAAEFPIEFEEDFGLGEELSDEASLLEYDAIDRRPIAPLREDDPLMRFDPQPGTVTDDMGDGRSAPVESDTLTKIESANEERRIVEFAGHGHIATGAVADAMANGYRLPYDHEPPEAPAAMPVGMEAEVIAPPWTMPTTPPAMPHPASEVPAIAAKLPKPRNKRQGLR